MGFLYGGRTRTLVHDVERILQWTRGPSYALANPASAGRSLGSLHTVRDKAQLGLVGQESILNVSREALAVSRFVVAQIQARAVSPGTNLIGIRITMKADNSPSCDTATPVLCDGGGYTAYFIEAIDRMGADSFTPDSGVMISKTKLEAVPVDHRFQPAEYDIQLLDFHIPNNGTASYITMGDYRQLLDALFHAGTRSGSQYEYVDAANSLHFYIMDVERDGAGVLSYTTAVRSTNSSTDTSTLAVALSDGKIVADGGSVPTGKGVTCSFRLKNTGESSKDGSAYLDEDVYRLNATVEGGGWKIELPNALATAGLGREVVVKIAVAVAADADADAADDGTVTLSATSELDSTVSATGSCVVHE
ncbi:putative secreted metallopeptidase [Lachnellula arida]|uniref:Putative secreted metallopeptidase n=1 Tax=Lachnellula arida TaxID=1316785 RepID=A0A8T9BIW3_9HELO|nr:putative secreted metallopeptidase [Lachnellula arida]